VDEKILVVSASSVKAREFVAQAKGILMSMELLAHLRPRIDQRDQGDRFDVNGASISQSPSLKAAGITGQITGSRATTIIPDDIEIPDNSRTEEARAYLLKQVTSSTRFWCPARAQMVIFLGTPQTEESIYNRLIKERGFNCFCFPARYPRADKRESYKLQRTGGEQVDILAPFLRVMDRHAELQWKPTDPQRFGEDRTRRPRGKGRSFFMLQFMLDTTLSDAERYPLKQFDLIVMSCNPMKAPVTIQWGRDSDKRNVRNDIPNVGFSGDYFLVPAVHRQGVARVHGERSLRGPFGSRQGRDRVGHRQGASRHPLRRSRSAASPVTSTRRWRDRARREATQRERDHRRAQLRWRDVDQRVPARASRGWRRGDQPAPPGAERTKLDVKVGSWSCSVYEAEWSKGMKEGRIIDTLEPVMNQHRLVVDESVARDETLMYQLTHIAKERNCLTHDDRIDAIAGAVNRLANAMMLDGGIQRRERLSEELDRSWKTSSRHAPEERRVGLVGTKRQQFTPRTGLVESSVKPDNEKPRKPFTRNLTLNVGKREYLVIGGLASKDADGRQPYVPAQRIASLLGLDQRKCVLADPRELGKIEAARAAGLAEYNITDLNRKLTS
jgi:hypothetical protein